MRRSRSLASLAAGALLALAGLTAAPHAAHAAVTEPTSWGKANLVSYADSDLESGVGNWVSYSNSTVAADTTTAFLHGASLKMTATAAGTQAAKLGTGTSAPEILVTGSDTYRISAWFRAPASAGRTVAFAVGAYTSAGTWLGWTSGTANTLTATGNWQYASETVTVPSTAAYVTGSPRVTETGAAAGESLNMDEMLFEPYRSATIIGAEDGSGNGTAFAAANTAIGPLQSDKFFYSPTTSLPSSYSGTNCATDQAANPGVTCVIAYKVATTNVAAFVASIPAGDNVIMTWWQEPENDTFSGSGTNGQNFVTDFNAQAALIRASTTSSNIANVFVADDALGYQYAAGTGHNDGGAPSSCSFIPSASNVDFYLDDQYQLTSNGGNLSTNTGSGSNAEWNGWLGCVSGQDKPIGIAEYGVNCGQAGGTGSAPNALTTSQEFAADSTYLSGEPAGLPVVMWEYWYNSNVGCVFTTGGSPSGTAAVTQWQANETQNGGGAN